MDATKALKLVENYKVKGGRWHELAGIIHDVCKNETWRSTYNTNSEWLDAVSKSSGFHSTVIRRMLRAKEFLERMLTEESNTLKIGEEIPLASLEILERLHSINPGISKRFLGKVLCGEMTYREVQKEYDTLVFAQTEKKGRTRMGPRLSKEFHYRAIKAIQKNRRIMSGNIAIDLYPLPKDMPYALDTDAITILNNNGKKGFDGFIIHYLSFDSDAVDIEELNFLVKNVAFNSNFFRRLWIILPDKNDKLFLNMLLDKLKCLELNNVAIALLCYRVEAKLIESWESMISVFNPTAETPQQEGFFPTDKEFYYLIIYKHFAPCFKLVSKLKINFTA
jgi:hypothetical protein